MFQKKKKEREKEKKKRNEPFVAEKEVSIGGAFLAHLADGVLNEVVSGLDHNWGLFRIPNGLPVCCREAPKGGREDPRVYSVLSKEFNLV